MKIWKERQARIENQLIALNFSQDYSLQDKDDLRFYYRSQLEKVEEKINQLTSSAFPIVLKIECHELAVFKYRVITNPPI